MAYPGGLQLGGGVTCDNAADFLNAGASHVIVTSFVFREGRLEEERLRQLVHSCCSCLNVTSPPAAQQPRPDTPSVMCLPCAHGMATARCSTASVGCNVGVSGFALPPLSKQWHGSEV